jgi:two-component system cell cycle sensor histidine kinase/response regulator CckA
VAAGGMWTRERHRRRAEEALRHSEAQLLQAQKMEAVGRLAGGVAHDFNNILAIILNYATILKQQLADTPLTQIAGDLLQVAKQGADLTRQLLIVGRRGIVEPMLVNVPSVVLSLENLLRKTLGENVRLELDLSGDVALVRMGLPQLEQLVMNLSMNARDAMPDGGRLSVRVRQVELAPESTGRYFDMKPGAYVVLEIQDTGTGMPEDVAARAFEPFFTTKGPAGTGLGLSTVHGIVKQASGHIEIESTPGAGTLVRVHLPAAKANAASADEAEAAAPARTGNGEMLLLVEDSDRLRALVRDILEKSRYRVLEARSPSDALELYERHAGAIDLLLTDVIMPEMSGRRLSELLRERFGFTRVAFMSGYDDDVLARQGILPEGTWLLQKPFVDRDLLEFVRKALDAQSP